MDDRHTGYFGYGSLVNSRTRSGGAGRRSFVQGWIRQWRHCSLLNGHKCCALTVAPRDGVILSGVFVADSDDGLAKIDEREEGYSRERVSVSLERAPRKPEIIPGFLYLSEPPYRRAGDDEYPIWRTYLDCVLAGYLRTFGVAGAEDFVRTTEGWDCPIVDDRSAPLYPRADVLTETEAQIINRILTEHGIL